MEQQEEVQVEIQEGKQKKQFSLMPKMTNGRVFKDDATEAWYAVGKVFIVLYIIAAIVFWVWGDYLTHRGVVCAFYRVSHLYCPGCGCTRATYWMMHLHFWRSFLCNPFIMVTTVTYILFMINTFFCIHTKRLGFTGIPITNIVYADLAFLVVQCVIRNILYVGFNITCL